MSAELAVNVSPDMSELGYWRVLLALPQGDAEAIRFAAPRVVPGERHAVITEQLPDGAEGTDELAIDVGALNRDDAVREAATLYARIRKVAGLPQLDMRLIGLLSPLFQSEAWDRLWEEANELHAAGRHELAIVRAQTACECLAVEAIAGASRGRLGRGDGDAIAKLSRATLNDPRTQRLLHGLTSGRVPLKFKNDDPDWWGDYKEHLQRRHDVVHKGIVVLGDDAGASLDAVERCMAWLRKLWAGELPSSPKSAGRL